MGLIHKRKSELEKNLNEVENQILKKKKSVAEMKTFCSKCLAKDSKLCSF